MCSTIRIWQAAEICTTFDDGPVLKNFLRQQVTIVRNKLDSMSTDILSTVILYSRFSTGIFLHHFVWPFWLQASQI